MATDSVTAATSVDPSHVDWDAVFDHADEAELGIVERRDAIIEEVEAIVTEEQVDDLIERASSAGVISNRADGTIVLNEENNATSICAADIDWQNIWKSFSPDGELTSYHYSQAKSLLSLNHSHCPDEEAAGELLLEARDRGELVEDGSEYYPAGAKLNGSRKNASNQSDESDEADDDDSSDVPSQFDGKSDAEKIDLLIERQQEIEQENRELRGLVQALRKQNKRLTRVIAGDDGLSERIGYEDQRFTDLITRVEDAEETLSKHDERLLMFDETDNKRSAPDSRALKLRQILTKECDDGGKAKLTRDKARVALGGDLHRGSVLDAMKRAADGRDASKHDRSYTEINGSCDLKPIDGIDFYTGSGRSDQSYLEIDLTNVTKAEMRKNLTTKNNGTPGV